MDSDQVHAFLGRESFKGMTRDEFGAAIDQVQALLDDISEHERDANVLQDQKDNARMYDLDVIAELVP